MPSDQTTRIPHVPVRTPPFHERNDLTWTRNWIIFFERLAGRLGLAGDSVGELKATFGLVRALTVENDLTNHFICRTGGSFTDVAVDAKGPPTGSGARFQVEISTDQAQTWNNIYAAPGYVEIAAGTYGEQIFTPDYAVASIAKGNLLRINCTQIGSTYAGKNVEYVQRWV